MISKANRLAPLGIIAFWLLLTAVAYFGFSEFFKPVPQVITSHGDLVLTRARDGHFYADGTINGAKVRFLVDTGAAFVAVSESFAKRVGLTKGALATFHTANGVRPGYMASNAVVSVGSLSISALSVGVGLDLGSDAEDSVPRALLGQNFLAKFDVSMGKDQMVVRQR